MLRALRIELLQNVLQHSHPQFASSRDSGSIAVPKTVRQYTFCMENAGRDRVSHVMVGDRKPQTPVKLTTKEQTLTGTNNELLWLVDVYHPP